MNNIISIIFGSLSALIAILMMVILISPLNQHIDSPKLFAGTVIIFILNVLAAWANFDQIKRRK